MATARRSGRLGSPPMRPALALIVAVALMAALAAPAAAGSGTGDDASLSAAKKCRRGYVRKKAGRGTRCVKKKAPKVPAGTTSFDGKTVAGKYLRFVISGGKLASFHML